MGRKQYVFFNEISDLDAEVYLWEMAAAGRILEDVNHLAYIFREGEPEKIFYKIEKRERYLSDEEREALAADGWQEVCHYELHYVYCRKGTTKDPQCLKPRTIEQELERASDAWEDHRKFGTKMGWILLIAAIVFSLGRKIYYMENFNEKSFPLPTEISYAEVPAVRLENLIDEPLTWTGTAFDPSLEGLRFEPDRAKTFSYDIDKKYGQIKNFGTDYKHIPGIEKKTETRQQMQNAEGIEWELDTMYTRYSGVKEAEGGFSAEVKKEAEWEEYWKKKEIDIPKSEPLPVENAFFDELHVCCTIWSEETDYHMVCRKGAQLMGVDYQGDDRTDAILKEVEDVFLAQK